jgi:hypothetical protein
MNCVGSNLGAALTYDDGEHEIYVDISSDTGNLTEYGSDSGIYTPPTVITAGTATSVSGAGTPEDPYVINTAPEVGDTAIVAGENVTISGTGITADPYVISTDQGRAYAYGVSDTVTLPTANNSYAALTPAIEGATDGFELEVQDNGNTRVLLPKAGVYTATAQFRFGISGQTYSMNSHGELGGNMYAAISGNGRGRVQAMSFSRNSSIFGMTYVLTDDFPYGGSIGFNVAKWGFNAPLPTASVTWSVEYVGPGLNDGPAAFNVASVLARELDGDPGVGS